jgi:hypothetical protein
VKLTEMPCQVERHEEQTECQDGHMPDLAQVETTNADDQSIGHCQVQHPPEDVYRRR